MRTLFFDLRYALRRLRRNPGFAIVSVGTLAVAIGAATAMFTVVDGVLLRTLPYPDSERLIRVWHNNTRTEDPRETVSHETFRELLDGVPSVEAAAGISPRWSFTLGGEGEPERIQGYWVSASFFELLGVRPQQGRGRLSEEDRPEVAPVAVISHGLWQRRFGGDPAVVGDAITLGAGRVTVVGIMPLDFRFGEAADIWLPLALNPIVGRGRQVRWVDVVARLTPGSMVEGAREEAAGFMQRLKEDHPDANVGLGATVEDLRSAVVGDVRPTLWIPLGGVGLVLLIACGGLLFRSFVELVCVDQGFRAEGVLTLQLALPAAFDSDRAAFSDALFTEIAGPPGVRTAGGVTRLPLGEAVSTRLRIQGQDLREGEQPEVQFRRAGGDYFRAMGIPVLRGRAFERRDGPDTPGVMLVSQSAAERLWPGDDPVGKEVRFSFAGITSDAPWIEVVGVTGDVRQFGLDEAPPPVVYVPFSQGPPGSPLVAVRAERDPMTLVGPVGERIRALAPGTVVWDVQTMGTRVATSLAGRRFSLLLVGAFGLLALGLAATLLGSRVLEGLLFGVDPTDPLALAGVTGLFTAVPALATWLPAHHAARIDPMEALRHE